MQGFPRMKASSAAGIKLLPDQLCFIPQSLPQPTLKRSSFVEITVEIILSKCYEPTLTNPGYLYSMHQLEYHHPHWSKATLTSINSAMFFHCMVSKSCKPWWWWWFWLYLVHANFWRKHMETKLKGIWRSLLCGAFENLSTLEQFKLMDYDTVWTLSTQEAKAEWWWL